MVTKKKKLSKKEIKEDKLVTSFYKIQQFYEEYQQKILILVGAVAVIVLAVAWYVNNQKENNLQANLELSRLMEIYDSGSYQEAIDGRPGTNIIGLKKLISEYGSSDGGEVGKILLGNAQFALGRYDEALDAYSDYSGDIDIHKSAAKAGKAACYEVKKEYEKAANLYESAAEVSKLNPLNPDYLLNAGINYLKIGKKDNAKEVFDILKADYKTSQSFREADKYISQL